MIPQTGSTPYRKHHRISTTASSSSSTNNCTFFSSQLSPVSSINTTRYRTQMCSHHTDITNVQYRRILELKHATLSGKSRVYIYSILLLPRPTWHNFHLRSTSIATRQVKSAIILDLLANHISGYNQLKFQCLFHYLLSLGISRCHELFTLESIYPKQLESTYTFFQSCVHCWDSSIQYTSHCSHIPLLMHRTVSISSLNLKSFM